MISVVAGVKAAYRVMKEVMRMRMEPHRPNGPGLPGLDRLPDKVAVILNESGGSLPHPDQISYYVLENERKLYLDEDVGESILQVQRMILRWNAEDRGKAAEERVPIRLYIFSYGGDIDYMWSLIDTIESSATPVYTCNMGVAASAASLIFLAGHRRFMLKRSKVVIHEGSARMSGDSTKVLDASDSYRKGIRKMKDYILERTGISASVLNRQKNHDWELDAEYCAAHGVCDRLVGSLDEIL